MFDEPFRWLEAVSTRHSYVQEKLKKGQPVIAVPYNEGALLMGFTAQPGKVFELYDRIALGGLGHPADVERLRMALLDMAHLEGFNRSDKDVTIARLLQFGIAPVLKQNFEEVQRAPYLAQLLLVEINFENQPIFYRLNYDGHWETFHHGAVIAGNYAWAERIEAGIKSTDFASMSLDQAMQEVCRLWESSSKAEGDDEPDGEDKPITLKEAFDQWTMEAAVLSTTSKRKSLYRPVSADEIETLKAGCLK